MNSQVTAKQHFIPKFYLKYFSNEKNFIQVYDLENDRFGKPRSYAGLGYEYFYYANKTGIHDELSQHVESWLRDYETILSEEINLIIPKIKNMEKLTEDDKYSLAAFMCFMWLRAPNMRHSINKMRTDLTKQVMSLGIEKNIDRFIKDTKQDLSDTEKKELIETFKNGDYDLKFGNAPHIRMMIESLGIGDKGFTNIFFAKRWKIYINKSSKKFITSDSPVVEWWLPPKFFMDDATMLERDNFFSLTPEILIELSKPKVSRKINRKTLFDEDKDVIKSKNIMIASHARKYIYSCERDMVSEIINGRNNPGPVEIDHYKKFDLPWREYHLNKSSDS
ncbi:MAG: DUF4238 domain-containing protein [Candidatus Pacebacteria bacterium]|jgi:hypothetical protein|nr:DUF4238 domain-containing protein [Candidatus Paceibacterota bacterium]MBT3511876.1 DUF4238 domain-containing protein [Candidatus Paceibacterota bacterium]MBT4005363.1 DUF4238 domain-containing protein [Candidatus Paceibacterota bacterium]MBT4359270.1 DUF4238 domain-containing protein [Candidatus Paceibacterota bacterium]MBT4680895.1 DUF4238 domain-containing protein [Candidatus Paceibacterota bacterium]